MKALKKVKPIRIIFLIVLLAGNTFAWFIYTTKVDSSISVHVKAWDVLFKNGEDDVTSSMIITVDNVYPGMEQFLKQVSAYNNSDISATLSYRVLEANILGDEYITTEGRADRGEEPDPDDLTNEELVYILSHNFPFVINLSISNETVSGHGGEETYSFTVNWPFEQNDDELDTYWGIRAANYKKDNPDLSSITLKIKLIVIQNPS